ncbi:hypothetical protein FGO68_gene3141 [Halteria grandinella]|uniref:Secreted protein n=1 Tax=Halteria grandinella TaxID=5974 RepID=A0A8J8SXF4_HALGN|nr:hypothetical protein FGO68_gene3141 [Halteria grandinella]
MLKLSLCLSLIFSLIQKCNACFNNSQLCFLAGSVGPKHILGWFEQHISIIMGQYLNMHQVFQAQLSNGLLNLVNRGQASNIISITFQFNFLLITIFAAINQ